MRNYLSFIALCFLAITMNAQEFKFDKETINYGKIAQGAEGNKTFEFTNVGTAPLVIQKIASSCGCAVSKKPTKPVMPGEKGKIEVSYDTKRTGSFTKMFTVISNAKTKRKALKIKGFIEKSVVAVK